MVCLHGVRFRLSQATGLENAEAYNKDGPLVETLKHNASLALFLLANDEPKET